MYNNLESPGVLVTAPRTLDYIHGNGSKIRKTIKNDFLETAPLVDPSGLKTYSFDYFHNAGGELFDSPDGIYYINDLLGFYRYSSELLSSKFNTTTGKFENFKYLVVDMIFNPCEVLRNDEWEFENTTTFTDERACELTNEYDFANLPKGGIFGEAEPLGIVCGGVLIKATYYDRGKLSVEDYSTLNEERTFSIISNASDAARYTQLFWCEIPKDVASYAIPLHMFAIQSSWGIALYNPNKLHDFKIEYSSYNTMITPDLAGIIMETEMTSGNTSAGISILDTTTRLFIPYRDLLAITSGSIIFQYENPTDYIFDPNNDLISDLGGGNTTCTPNNINRYNINNFYNASTGEFVDLRLDPAFSTIVSAADKLEPREFAMFTCSAMKQDISVYTQFGGINDYFNQVDDETKGERSTLDLLLDGGFSVSTLASDLAINNTAYSDFQKYDYEGIPSNRTFYGYCVIDIPMGAQTNQAYAVQIHTFNESFTSIIASVKVDLSTDYWKSCLEVKKSTPNYVPKIKSCLSSRGLALEHICLHYNSDDHTYDLYYGAPDCYNRWFMIKAQNILNNLVMGENGYLVPKESSIQIFPNSYNYVTTNSANANTSQIYQESHTYSWSE